MELKIDLFPPVRHSPKWAITIWRGNKVEDMRSFATEKEARRWLRRCGYPYTKAMVPVKAG